MSTDTTWAPPEVRKCGRATKSGSPCKQIMSSPSQVACRTHATEWEDGRETGFQEGWREGHQKGYAAGVARAEAAESRLRKMEPDFNRRPCKHVRMETAHGQQIVQVRLSATSEYAYVWSDIENPLAVGDSVELPPAPWMSSYDSQVGVVVQLGTDFPGELASIRRRV